MSADGRKARNRQPQSDAASRVSGQTPVPIPGSAPASRWELRLRELLDFFRAQGHFNVPRSWLPNPKLANWVNNQRRLLQRGLLGAERLRRLRQFDIAWTGAADRHDSQQETWDRMFLALQSFKRSAGHHDVPRGWTPEPSLASWMASQRYLWRRGSLPTDRSRRLSELDPQWHRVKPRERGPARPKAAADRRVLAWERRFEALMDFRRIHGHCAVPARWEPDRPLAGWVVSQRLLRRRGRLRPDRRARLEAVGFPWSGADLQQSRRDHRWEVRFLELAGFTAAKGHCNVSRKSGAPAGLAAWVFRQRVERRQGRLSADRIRRLEGLKFHWKVRGSRH